MVFPPACHLHLLLPARGLHEDDHLQELQAFLLEPLLFGNCRVTLSIRFNVSLLGKSPAAYGGWSERLSCRCDRSVDPKGGAFSCATINNHYENALSFSPSVGSGKLEWKPRGEFIFLAKCKNKNIWGDRKQFQSLHSWTLVGHWCPLVLDLNSSKPSE